MMSCIIIFQPEKLSKSLFPPNSTGVPLLTCKVSAGFPSPADDHLDNALNIQDLLIKKPSSTFFVRATGNSMKGAGIYNNDILIVDRSVVAVNGSVVIAAVDGECLVKILRRDSQRTWLQAAHPKYADLQINEGTSFEVWGVVTGVVRQHESNGRVCTD
jgi:DNA polymerase V